MYYSNKYDENTINYILNSLDKSSYTISKELNIPASTIRKIRKQNNIDMSTKQTKISNDLMDIIYQEVMQGKSFTELGKKYNIDRKLISKKLEEIYNFKKKRKCFTEEERRAIYEEAKNNLNSDLAKKYNCNESTIQRIYKEYANTNEDKIYNYERYFDNINSYDKAYWLGFIAADGCLYEDQDKYYSLIISLQEQDKYILEKFYLCINKTIRNNIYETIQNDKKYYSIKIGSRHMGKSLLKLNITPRKTWIYEPIPLEDRLFFSYLRGYFDGDGCITTSDYSLPSKYECRFYGNYNTMIYIQKFLSKYNISSSLYEDNRDKKYTNNFYQLVIHNVPSIYLFLKSIYYDINKELFLTRKYEKAIKFINLVEENNGNYKKYDLCVEEFKNCPLFK